MKLIQELYGKGIISEEKRKELSFEIEKTGKTEEEIISENKIIPEGSLFELKSKLINIPLMKLDQKEIPLEILELISGAAAMNYKMVPLFKKGSVVGIGMVYPEDISSQNALRFLSRKENFTYEIYLITFSDLNNILKQYRTLKRETKKALTELGKQDGQAPEALDDESEIKTDKAQIIKMVMVILR